jgi:hypothetical protein
VTFSTVLARATQCLSVGLFVAACGGGSSSAESGTSASGGSNSGVGTSGGSNSGVGTSGGSNSGSTPTSTSTGGSKSAACLGTMWTRGESATMRPGEACISCHSQNPEAPVFVIAGTVYSAPSQPDDCNGTNNGGAAVVVITDAQGTEHRLAVNQAGNFLLEAAPIPTPFHARVEVGSAVRSMVSAQTIGDCNLCHTSTGANGAPGRILSP